MIRVGCKGLNRLGVAAQFVRYHDTGRAELCDQFAEETPRCLGVATRLNKNVEHITVCINRPPEPVFRPGNDDHRFVEVPFVVWLRSVPADAVREMPTEPVHPFADRLPADTDAPLCQQVFNVCRTQREAMISPDCIGDD